MPSFTASQKLGVQPTVTPQYLETARVKDETGKQRVADSLLAEEIAKKDKDFATMWAKRRAGGEEAATGLLNYYTYGDPNYGKQTQPAQYQFTQNDAAGYFNNPDEILSKLQAQNPETRIPGAFSIEGATQDFNEHPIASAALFAGKGLYNAGAGVVNVTKSLYDVTGLPGAKSNPAQAISGIARGVAGAGELAFEGVTGKQVPEFNADGTTTPVKDTKNQQVAKTIWEELIVKRYGGVDALKKTLFEDPVGVLADVLTVGEGLKLAKGAVAGKSAVTKASEAAATANTGVDMKALIAKYGSEDAIPLSAMSPQGVADAAAGTALVRAGGTAEDAAKVSGAAAKGASALGTAETVSPLGVLGKIIKAPFKGAKKIGEGAASMGKDILGYSTGTGRRAIDGTLRTARIGTKEGIRAMAEGVKAGSVNEARALEDIMSNLYKARDMMAETYQSQLSKLKSDTLDTERIGEILKKQISKFNLELSQKKLGKGNLADETYLGYNLGSIAPGSPAALEIEAYIKEALNWGKDPRQTFDVLGLDTIKKRLSDIFPESPKARAFVTPIQNAIVDALNKVPGYKEMTSTYEEFSSLLTDVKQTLSIGGSASRDTAIRKLTNMLKNNHEHKEDVLRALLEITGDTTTLPKLVGVSMSSAMPRGIAGVAQSINLSMNAYDIGRLAGRLSTIVVSSPRVVHEFLKAVGLTQRQIDKVIEMGRKAGLKKVFNDTVVGAAGEASRVNDAAQKKKQVEDLFPNESGQNEQNMLY